MHFRTSLIALLFAFSAPASAQPAGLVNTVTATENLAASERRLVQLADSMNAATLPEEQLGRVYQFVSALKQTLALPGSYRYTFDSLKAHINILQPEDSSFRIFNWQATPADNVVRYYGAIQMAGEELKLYGLTDQSAQIQKGAMDSVLANGRWFGALYYRIMPVMVDGRKAYTLFGLNGSNPLSNRKVLDLLWFSNNGPVFGAPVFGVRSPDTKQQAMRFVMEYRKNIVATLNYNNTLNAIYFDRLESETNDPGRKYTYIPTGQYDGFRWQNGMWTFVQNLIPIRELENGQDIIGGNEQYDR